MYEITTKDIYISDFNYRLSFCFQSCSDHFQSDLGGHQHRGRIQLRLVEDYEESDGK